MRATDHATDQVISIEVFPNEVSKTDVLTQGDEVGVFSSIEGTEQYFLEHVKFIVGADGRSLSTTPAVYYPEAKQAVRFFACFPYHSGVFSVPSDQSMALALKQADLCWATASSTPAKTAVPLEFAHKMARLLIAANEPITKIVAPNVFSGGTLDIKTGAFTNTTKATISTAGTELILPAQTVTRLVLTVAGIEYVFEGAVLLETAKTTTLGLTLHPDTHTAMLSGSSVTDWGPVKTEGSPSHAVSNTLLLHWPSLPQGATPDQVVLTIGRTDYTVSSGIRYANHTFTVPFTSSVLCYPYTISNITFYQAGRLVQSCANLLGGTSYKAGNSTIGINPSAIRIGDLIWAAGNLVASNAAAGARGEGGCRIGAPADGGLYFQFGSLIGYKGGNQVNGGTGVGMPQAPLTTNGAYWNGAAVWSWDNEAMVWPTVMTPTPTSWPQEATTNQWYFGLQTDWGTAGKNIRDFPNFATGGLANMGVGDPCSYYLGGNWRLPTTEEQTSIAGKTTRAWTPWTTDGITGRWATKSQTFFGVSGPGAWFGTGLSSGMGTPSSLVNAFFPASGYRDASSSGSFYRVTEYGNEWSSSISNITHGYGLDVHGSFGVVSQRNGKRPMALPVRCVAD